MVHFYHEISSEELLDICLNHTDEIDRLLERMLQPPSRAPSKGDSLRVVPPCHG